MKSFLNTHPTMDDLEYYSMNHQRNDNLIEAVEEHLLICENCRCNLDEVEQEVRVLKIVLREAEASGFVN
jgi:predicted anti-sigma-YlaC factor YlaD